MKYSIKITLAATEVFLAVTVLASCKDESAVKIVIEDPESLVPNVIDSLVVTYAYYSHDGGSHVEESGYRVSRLPQSIVIHKGSTYDYGVRVWIKGFQGNAWRLSCYRSALFPGHGIVEYAVDLDSRCLDRCLSTGLHCEEGTCVPDEDPAFPSLDASVDEDAGVWDVAVEDASGEDVLEEDPSVEDGGGEDVLEEDPAAEGDAPDADELPPGLVWVSIPAGTFEMGCSPGDDECKSDENPRHNVTVPAFEMNETEITQAQYEWVTGSNPSYHIGCPSCPVEQVTWYESKAFCEAIGARLPSEAEWEYAARAGTTTRYYCGDDPACLDAVAWYSANSGSTTHPVGEKTANAFGLFDILGNVWEWVDDCWHEDYTGAPNTGVVWMGGDCDYRLIRGGSWYDPDGYVVLRVSKRIAAVHGNTYRHIGFRCAQ